MTQKPTLISIRFRFCIGTSDYDVLAVGKGHSREVRICDTRNNVVWHAPFRGPLNSNRARVAASVFAKGKAHA